MARSETDSPAGGAARPLTDFAHVTFGLAGPLIGVEGAITAEPADPADRAFGRTPP